MRAILAAAAAAAVAPVGAQFTLNLLDAAKHPLAQCLDGSQGGYYISPGTDGGDTVVIHTQGGGWCVDEQDCIGRSKTPLGSSLAWTKGFVNCSAGGAAAQNAPVCYADGGDNGMISNDPAINPLLANSTKLFVGYCDGGSYAGTVQQPVHTNGTVVYFRGRYILDAIYDELLAPGGPLATAKNVIIKGCSAGGLAVYLHVDYLAGRINAVNPGARVLGSPGAGLFLDVNSLAGNKRYTPIYQYVANMQQVLQKGSVNDDCLADKAPSDQWQCFMAPYTLPYIKTPVFIMNSLADAWQQGNIMGLGCNPAVANSCNATQIAYLNNFRLEMIAALAPVTSQPQKHGVFAQSCSVHVVEDTTHYYTQVKVAGQTEASAFAAWFNGQYGPATQVIDGQFGTNPTC